MNSQAIRKKSVVPRQDRSRRTREAIVASAREVVIEKGRDRATTTEVAMRAEVGIGTLYRYFVDFADLMEVILAETPVYANHQAVLSAARAIASSEDSEDAEEIAVQSLRNLIASLRAYPHDEDALRLYS
ncbi:TetR/AcrR family transcriptional regulator [Rathayibacter sp. AY1C2]|uniref:TetR/AcrR family transcriptional regulator n=1 Tax=Rathayibacter sp. AY1C2 TaxID=2080535 RepID=UPI001C679085|nr:helix-turn-helix domain-containing protein [Rathayibacter sp. AY1C2]